MSFLAFRMVPPPSFSVIQPLVCHSPVQLLTVLFVDAESRRSGVSHSTSRRIHAPHRPYVKKNERHIAGYAAGCLGRKLCLLESRLTTLAGAATCSGFAFSNREREYRVVICFVLGFDFGFSGAGVNFGVSLCWARWDRRLHS